MLQKVYMLIFINWTRCDKVLCNFSSSFTHSQTHKTICSTEM